MDNRKEMVQEARHERHMAKLTVIKIHQLKKSTPLLERLFSKEYKIKMNQLMTEYSIYRCHAESLLDKLEGSQKQTFS